MLIFISFVKNILLLVYLLGEVNPFTFNGMTDGLGCLPEQIKSFNMSERLAHPTHTTGSEGTNQSFSSSVNTDNQEMVIIVSLQFFSLLLLFATSCSWIHFLLSLR